MEAIQEIEKTIQRLVDNEHISAYKIGKDIGISDSSIKKIRQGTHNIKKLKFETIIALYEYQKELEQQ